MEDQIIDNTFDEGLQFNAQIKTYLRETAGWAKFLSIVGFVMTGLMVLMGLFAGTLMSSFADLQGAQTVPGMGAIFSVYFIAIAAILFFPYLYLFRFASKAKSALDYGSEEEMTLAIQNLKSHYKFFGILTAIFLGLYALGLIFALIGGVLF